MKNQKMYLLAKLIFGGIVYLLLNGCANQIDSNRQLARNDNFTIIHLGKSDTYASLAKEYLGSAKYASIIKRYNPQLSLSETNYVAIPRVNLNRTGVFTNGYQQIPILCYHQFTKNEKGRSTMVVSEQEFRNQMRFLHENGYTVIPLSDVGKFIRGNKELPENAVVITIDDGYKSYMEIAYPILKEYKFPSTMFVYPEFVGAGIALKWRDVKTLNDDPLVDIQSHSKTHDSLARRPLGEDDDTYRKRLSYEVVEAEQIISKRTGNVINQFAYPYGNSSAMLVEMLQENEYDLALTVKRGSNPAFSAPFLLYRTMIYGGNSLRTFKKSLNTFSPMDLK